MTEAPRPIHIEADGGGPPLCGEVPWMHERYVPWHLRAEATCDACLTAAFKRQAHSDPKVDEDPEADPGTPVPTDAGTPVRAHLLTPELELELLQAAFAWRAQGSLTRWKTGPSRELAKLVAGLELPKDVRAALQQQALEKVAEDALTRRYSIQESKGRARELQALFENLGEIAERLALVVEEEHFAADEQLAELKLPSHDDPDFRAQRLIERARQGQGRHDVKLVVDYLQRQKGAL